MSDSSVDQSPPSGGTPAETGDKTGPSQVVIGISTVAVIVLMFFFAVCLGACFYKKKAQVKINTESTKQK